MMKIKHIVIASLPITSFGGRAKQSDTKRHPERSEGSEILPRQRTVAGQNDDARLLRTSTKSAQHSALSEVEGLRRLRLLAMTVALPIFFLISFSSFTSLAQTAEPSQEPAVNYLFRDSYYASPQIKLKYDIYEAEGILLVQEPKRLWHSGFSIVTGFNGPVLESRTLKGIRNVDEAKKFVEKNSRKIFFERIPIREIPLNRKDGTLAPRYWVGQRAFDDLEQAKASVISTKTAVEAGGGNFERALELVTEYFPEEIGPSAEEIRANYIREEELALKMLDWLDVGEKLYGPLTGTALGERILWQSFGETTFRNTNLDNSHYNSQVGFWTNRMVFKGIRLLGEPTLDPYVEVTAALESNGKNFPKHLDLVGGLEYRPFGRVAFFDNFNIAGLHVLKFARNYRAFVQYMERKNISDEITGSADTDLWAGADIFYEWGYDLERPWITSRRESLADWIADYVWGEYFGSYRWQKTDFSTNKSFHAWILNSSIILGIKWPRFALPENPINNEFVLMPYLRFEHTTNPSRAELAFQNQMFVAAGIRWMPFRSFQFENNEWLFKTKIFGEYVGIGEMFNPGEARASSDVPEHDWRAGVAVSFRRY